MTKVNYELYIYLTTCLKQNLFFPVENNGV